MFKSLGSGSDDGWTELLYKALEESVNVYEFVNLESVCVPLIGKFYL